MDNKIQQLTEKLYQEGLSKGKAEAEAIVAEAKKEAARIIEEARKKADETAKDAETKAAETIRRGESELKMAASQLVTATRNAVSSLIVAKAPSEELRKAFADDSFVRGIMTEALKGFANGGTVTVNPANVEKAESYIKAAAASLPGEFTVKGADGVGRGFRVEPKGEGYYISFDEKEFDSLLKSYLKTAVTKVLFEEK